MAGCEKKRTPSLPEAGSQVEPGADPVSGFAPFFYAHHVIGNCPFEAQKQRFRPPRALDPEDVAGFHFLRPRGLLRGRPGRIVAASLRRARFT